jgi:hypothetical protein
MLQLAALWLQRAAPCCAAFATCSTTLQQLLFVRLLDHVLPPCIYIYHVATATTRSTARLRTTAWHIYIPRCNSYYSFDCSIAYYRLASTYTTLQQLLLQLLLVRLLDRVLPPCVRALQHVAADRAPIYVRRHRPPATSLLGVLTSLCSLKSLPCLYTCGRVERMHPIGSAGCDASSSFI